MKYKKIPSFILLSMILLAIIIQTSVFIAHEQNIYYWDFNGYWRMWEEFCVTFPNEPINSIRTVFHSVRHDDYNSLPVALTSWLYIFDLPSRLSYIISLAVMYLFPTVILFHLLCKRFSDNRAIGWLLLTCILPLTFVAFWAPTMKGYPDISGLIPIIAALLYVSNNDLGDKVRIKKALVTGLLLWSPFLLRRWYAYTVVSLYLSLPVFNYFIYNNAKHSFGRVIITIKSFFAAGTFSVLLTLIFQGALIRRIIETDYSTIYSAYQSSLAYSIETLYNNIGLYLLPFIIIGLLSIFVGKDRNGKLLVIFSAFNLIFSFFLFTRTQSPGVQHCLPFALWALIIAAFGLKILLQLTNNKAYQCSVFGIVTVSCVFINYASLFSANQYQPFGKFLPIKSLPMHVDNFNNYVELVKNIETLTQGKDKVTILSSSSVLNDDMINTLSHRKLTGKIAYASQVDLRDGINVESLLSKYFVVADPVQTHLSPDGQRVITIPANEILSGDGIGSAFRKKGTGFKLSDGVTAYIYERIRPYTDKEIKNFFSLFFEHYPHWKENYGQGLYYSFLSANVVDGDIWGKFTISDDGNIDAHPGENTPTTAKWILTGINTLVFDSYNTTCNNADGVDIKISNSKGETSSIYIKNGNTVSIGVEKYLGAESTIAIYKHENFACDSIKITAK
ncbi:hypothetical protein B194_2163 [Serratia plymuthica A30]|uniref:hypothetical protein n=1 Tax=Serratia plymuthica TaxID=82996 RepID=UPI0002A3564B|nr:hypothetical protein [Serratia plymuthica]EKF64943.1 hypothetical protein B194_2163 [Serratia plymuthica A30]